MTLNKQQSEGSTREGGKDCKEKTAAALVTQLESALICITLPCLGKLSSTYSEYSLVVKVTSYLD